MKKTLLILMLITVLCLTGCEAELVDESVLGAYNNPEQEQQTDKTAPADVTLLYYPDMDTNPITTTCLANNQLLKLVYLPAIKMDATFKPVCVLAEKFEQKENTVTVTLKNGIKFSDGSEVTADDAVKSIRVASKNASSPYHSSALLIKNCYAVDTKTYVCTFSDIKPDLAGLLDIPIMKGGEAGIGCGPYKFSQQNGKAVLSVNEHYATKPAIDVLHLVETKTDEYVTTLFSAGELDVLSIPGSSDLSLTSLRNYSTITYPSNNLVYIGVNTAKEPFLDANVRKAISGCIDRQKIATQSLVNLAMPTVYPFNPEWYKMSVYNINSNPDIKVDTQPIKELKLTLLVPDGSDVKNTIAQALVESFKINGITLELSVVDVETYKTMITSGNFDLYLGETAVPRTMDPTFLYGAGGTMNYCGYNDQVLENAYAEYKTGAAGLDSYLKAFSESMPIIPVLFRKNVMYSNEGLEGWSQQTAWDGYGDFALVKMK